MPVKPLTIATLTAEAARALQRTRLLSASGYRVITPRIPADIVRLLANENAVALVVNNSLNFFEKKQLLQRVRQSSPGLLIVHVFRRGEEENESLADSDVDVTDPTNLVFELEKLLSSRGYGEDAKRA